jgi:16S rRNA (uracil1498-N3)-methyltransferase
MSLPFFYEPGLTDSSPHFTLSEETSKHCIQVLRMKLGEKLQLTDGKGTLVTAAIASEDKKKAVVTIEKAENIPPPSKKISIAISLLKNVSRFEWFLEKATEIGVTHIQPLICARTEHERFKTERMQGILISAMLQSQQVWLPEMPDPMQFERYISQKTAAQKLIAHCEENEKRSINDIPSSNDTLILIGPEGDFTTQEISSGLAKDYLPVSLGDTRLRTETAGIVAAALIANR